MSPFKVTASRVGVLAALLMALSAGQLPAAETPTGFYVPENPQYTEPFLNNQHIAEPTLFYLERLAAKTSRKSRAEYRDLEGNLIHTAPR